MESIAAVMEDTLILLFHHRLNITEAFRLIKGGRTKQSVEGT